MLLCSMNSFADSVNETFAKSCDETSQEMKLVSTFINLSHMDMNRIPEGFSLDLTTCDFLKKTKTKVTLLQKPASLRGACGANPEILLELIKPDGKSMKTIFSPKCGGTLIKSITISKKVTEFCEYLTVNYKAPWTEETTESEYVCRRL
jgi:hypothetical protein